MILEQILSVTGGSLRCVYVCVHVHVTSIFSQGYTKVYSYVEYSSIMHMHMHMHEHHTTY